MIRRNTWIAVGAFALVLLAALLLRPAQDEQSLADTTPTPEPLWTVDAEDIVRVQVENLDTGEAIEIRRDAEQLWSIVAPQPGPADPARVERAVSWLASPAPRAELHDVTDLSPFQLSEPTYRVELTLRDGRKLGFRVGREAPTGGSRYVNIDGREGVMVVSSFGLEEVLNLQPDLLPTPTPGPTATPTVPSTATESPPEAAPTS